MSDSTTEQHQFGAEVGRLLDLVVHALYSDREIFLRELVANAADATDRRRFEALTNPALATAGSPQVRIIPDKAARLLTISDEGIGMDRQELAENLGTIARSGTRAASARIAAADAADRPSLIGQFGVGFYAAFMVADRVEVLSRQAGAETAWRWSSDGTSGFSIAADARESAGTDVILHLKPDADEFLDPLRLDAIVRRWADHITVPISIVRDGADVTANTGTALWRRPKSEISEGEYAEFYRHMGHMLDTPWASLHWQAEGTLEFTALLFIPGSRPFAPLEGERESHVRLHVRRMFITDKAALLPPWLRFVAGLVDTDDLPLNVSREMLQATPTLARIRRALTSRVLSELKTRAAKDEADYATFWENFGAIMKEAMWEAEAPRAEVAPLLRFRSSRVAGWTTLADYIGRMRPGQESIWYLAGERMETLAGSPQLEGFAAREVEVLLLDDPVDAFWPERYGSHEGHQLRSASQGGGELGAIPLADQAAAAPPADIAKLTSAFAAALGDAVSGVRGTDRLAASAVVLAAGSYGPDLALARLLRRSGQADSGPAPVLELNPGHALIRALAARAEAGDDLTEAAQTLLDLARVQEGEPPLDPARFAQRIAASLVAGLGGEPAQS